MAETKRFVGRSGDGGVNTFIGTLFGRWEGDLPCLSFFSGTSCSGVSSVLFT